jgi:hypothetical protein
MQNQVINLGSILIFSEKTYGFFMNSVLTLSPVEIGKKGNVFRELTQRLQGKRVTIQAT